MSTRRVQVVQVMLPLPREGSGSGLGVGGQRFTCAFISQSLRQTVALRSFTATPQRIKCIHPDPRYKVRPRRGLGRSVGSARDCQGLPGTARVGAVTHVQTNKSVEYKKRFCLLHFIARAQGARAKERERGGGRVHERESKK